MKRNIYRSLTCFGNKFCRPMKLKKKNSLATVSKGMFREKQEQHFMKRKSCQLLSMGVDLSCFRVVLQPEVQETLHRSREEWIPLNASKFWRQKSNRLKKNKKCWSWKEDGFYNRMMILNIPRNPRGLPQETQTEGFGISAQGTEIHISITDEKDWSKNMAAINQNIFANSRA